MATRAVVLLALLLFATGCLGAGYNETCTQDSDCHIENCPSGNDAFNFCYENFNGEKVCGCGPCRPGTTDCGGSCRVFGRNGFQVCRVNNDNLQSFCQCENVQCRVPKDCVGQPGYGSCVPGFGVQECNREKCNCVQGNECSTANQEIDCLRKANNEDKYCDGKWICRERYCGCNGTVSGKCTVNSDCAGRNMTCAGPDVPTCQDTHCVCAPKPCHMQADCPTSGCEPDTRMACYRGNDQSLTCKCVSNSLTPCRNHRDCAELNCRQPIIGLIPVEASCCLHRDDACGGVCECTGQLAWESSRDACKRAPSATCF